jgi:hypothetical protein
MRGLGFEQAPPASVPLRFLLTAPWFLTLAALVLLAYGSDALASRWTPALLAATHLVTLGFMSNVMLGALFQLLPVVAGVPIRRAALVAAVVHPALTAGTLLLAAGLLFALPWALRTALVLLGVAFAVFLGTAGWALLRSTVRDASVRAMRLALVALLVTVALGSWLASALGWHRSAPLLDIVAQHAGWGLVGWTALLAVGVSIQVVPMFQLTPPYPPRVARWLPQVLFGAFAAWSLSAWLGWAGVARAFGVVAAAVIVVYAAATLALEHRSRRVWYDATLLTWRAAMTSLIAAAVVWTLRELPGADARGPLLIGMLFAAGFALSAIAGMLYNIVPFLLWIDLRRRARTRVPHVKLLLPDLHVRGHAWLHLASVACLVAAALWPETFARPAAASLLAASIALGALLLRAVWAAQRALRAQAG